jgi:hypothetical protein
LIVVQHRLDCQQPKKMVYLKLVVHDKRLIKPSQADGTSDEGMATINLKIPKRWLCAVVSVSSAWGYSTAIHSWLNNEGRPFDWRRNHPIGKRRKPLPLHAQTDAIWRQPLSGAAGGLLWVIRAILTSIMLICTNIRR